MTLWNKYFYGRQGSKMKKYNGQQRHCKICGRSVYIGDVCGSCKQFINSKKAEERS